jgi:hypothetical protein
MRCETLLGSCPDCPAWFLVDLGTGKVIDLHVSQHLRPGSLPMIATFPRDEDRLAEHG